MNILISLTYYTPNISGVTIYAQRLAEHFAANPENKVTVLASQHLPSLPIEETVDNITIKRLPVTFMVGKGPIMLSYPWVTLSEVRKADVINAHLPQFEVIFLALWAKLFRKKLILTHHTDLSIWPGVLFKAIFLGVLGVQLFAAVLADKLVIYTYDYARHSYFTRWFKKKWVQTYPPVMLRKSSKELRSDSNRKPAHTIGFSGRIARQKGLPHLINAIPILEDKLGKDFKVLLAGPYKEVIGEDYRLAIEDLIEKHKEKLVFLGRIDPEDMESFYRKLDVLVLPSDDRLESFGFVQVEAMLAGVPVVATNLPGVRVPVQRTGMGCLVEPGKPEALADAISKVLQNRESYVKSQELVKEVFSYEQTFRDYQQIFGTGD